MLHFVGVDLVADQIGHIVAERFEGHLSLVAFALRTNRYQSFGFLLFADDQQVGDALELVVADLAADLLVAVVHLRADVVLVQVNQAIEFFNEHGQKKIVKKLLPLQDVGLGYIKLGQSSSTLSGGENQRVKLAFYLSQEKADPTLFIFDEPTTGLHFHDIRKLLDAFDALIRRGHSIVIIEHNMDVIKCADYVIDLGPEGGDKGGNIVAVGTPEEVAACGASYTGQFLKEKLK